tara:strand:- start:3435 stop:4580 length:1146 start_codon:yes stop_codon:yes gene_type:complete
MSTTRKIQELASELSEQDISSVAFGFPTEQDTELYLQESADPDDFPMNDFDGADSRTSVNGDFDAIDDSSEFDGFDFVDDDFDNFTKKSRKRGKKRRETRKKLRDEGLSRKDARKQARTEALAEIPKDKLKDVLKKGFQNIGKAIKVGALAVPRGAYLSLIRVNYRGAAWKLAQVTDDPQYADKLKKIKDKFSKLGGRWDKLLKNINIGKRKKPFFCGKKCKKKLKNKGAKRSFTNFVEGNADFYNVEPATTTVAVSTWVAIGSSVLGAMTTAMGTIAMSKGKEKEIKAQKEIAEKELETLSETEKGRIALAEKQLKAQSDPIRAIMENPNLSSQEKTAAIASTEAALDKGNKRKIMKYAIIGGLVLAGIFIASKIIKNKN